MSNFINRHTELQALLERLKLVGMARAFGDQLVLSGVQLPWMAEAVRMSPA